VVFFVRDYYTFTNPFSLRLRPSLGKARFQRVFYPASVGIQAAMTESAEAGTIRLSDQYTLDCLLHWQISLRLSQAVRALTEDSKARNGESSSSNQYTPPEFMSDIYAALLYQWDLAGYKAQICR
jgi:hypothetical protein